MYLSLKIFMHLKPKCIPLIHFSFATEIRYIVPHTSFSASLPAITRASYALPLTRAPKLSCQLPCTTYRSSTATPATFRCRRALTMQDSITESKTLNYILFMVFC